ncbi:MAG: hypothetical protein GY730_07630 [bacterium]|nr:hypothetical protein [bacterium]
MLIERFQKIKLKDADLKLLIIDKAKIITENVAKFFSQYKIVEMKLK